MQKLGWLKEIMMNEKGPSQKHACCMILSMSHLWSSIILDMKNGLMSSRSLGGERGWVMSDCKGWRNLVTLVHLFVDYGSGYMELLMQISCTELHTYT